MTVGPGSLVGGYELEALAGRGASGAVYRARAPGGGSVVALKVLHSAAEGDAAKFEREASLLEGIVHPGLAGYLDHGVTDEGLRFLAMEWLEGETLRERFRRGALSVEQSVTVSTRVARALGAAHRIGVVHRDLKPANVFLCGGRLDDARVLDFGIALWGRSPLDTDEGAIAGTPAYMAPEQARAEGSIDARADVFSLGCVIYEALLGRPAFSGPHTVAVLARVVFDEVPRVDTLKPAVPARLGALVDRMLAKDPAARPDDGDAVAEALARVGVASSERPPPAGLRREQRLVSVFLARPRADVDLSALRADGARHGLDLARLAGGAIVGTLRPRDAATDLAEIAARSAAALREALGGARVALATGRAELSRGAPVGEAIDEAARLWRAGHEPALVIDETTRGLLGGAWQTRGAELVGPRGDSGRELLGRATPLVGRDRELAILEDVVAEAVEEEAPTVARVIAQPGLGKSRLRRELVERLGADPSLQVDYARGELLRAGSPLALVRMLLRDALDADETTTPDEGRARLAAHASEGAVEFLAEMLGWSTPVPSEHVVAARRDPTLMRDRQRAAWTDWLRHRSEDRGLAIVLEDLQWGDAPSVRLVESALDALDEAPIAVIAFARPEVGERLGPTFERFAPMELTLSPLSTRAASELVRAVLPDLPEDVVDRLVARAEGNAFYLEELIRAVAEGGDVDAFPGSVMAMAQARLERVEPEARQLLRAASVLGQACWPAALAALLDQPEDETLCARLDALVEGELLRRRARSRFADQPELAFRHDLVQQASYASLDEEDRRRAHAAAARWLAARGVDDPVSLATHHARAGEPDAAAEAWFRAAEAAMRAHDFEAALPAARRAAARATLAGRARSLEAQLHRWRGDHAAAIVAAAEAAARLEEGSAAWLVAQREALLAHGRSGDYAAVVALFEHALTLPVPEPPVAWALFFVAAGRQLFHAGRYDLADRAIEESLRAGDPDDLGPTVAAQVHGLRAAAARHRGDLAGDLSGYLRTLAAFERAGDDRNACNCRVSVGFAHAEVGDFDAAQESLERALEDARRLGIASIETRARQNLGLVLGSQGRFDEAAPLLEAVMAESRAQGNARFEGWTAIYRAQVALAAGDLEGSVEVARRGIDLLEVSPPARAGADAIAARALMRLGDRDEARALAARAMEVLEDLGGIEEFESLVRLAHAEVAVTAGDLTPLLSAHSRLLERARGLEGRPREGFLTRVPENAATFALVKEHGAV